MLMDRTSASQSRRIKGNPGHRNSAVATKQRYVELSRVTQVFPVREGNIQALKDVSLSVAYGEFVSIVGPSGCGKSTLALRIAGLLPPQGGRITVNGCEVVTALTDVGIVFQNPVLLAWRSALENVLLQIEMRGGRVAQYRDLARELLARVGLAGFEGRLPHELSGGMQQRVSICRALIHDPPLLLMDEPFGALDAITRDQLSLDTQRLCAHTGKTVIFITHSIAEAVFLSDRVVVMTPRPGRVDKIITISLPRPRRLRMRADPQFVAHTQEIHERFLAHGIFHDVDDTEELEA
jgi:NitT/TauT family transport system ATP-binding protein